jgi:hypothetical protein
MSVSPSAGIIWRAVTEMFTRSMYVTILIARRRARIVHRVREGGGVSAMAGDIAAV